MKLIISIIIDIMYNYAISLIRKIICKNEYSSIIKKKKKKKKNSSVVDHSSANPKVPGAIRGMVSYWGHGL